MASNPQNPSTYPLVELFTDGSCCHGNPGPGGWAFILRHSASKIERVVCGGLGYTTNERMEMIAVINGLRSLKRACRVTLYTDSKSVVAGITKRVAEWKQFGWRKSVTSKKFVQNADLWMHLAKQCSRHSVDARWVKGHAGHAENERCDKLARQEARRAIENLESSAQKGGAGVDPLLADWVSTPVVPTAVPGGGIATPRPPLAASRADRAPSRTTGDGAQLFREVPSADISVSLKTRPVKVDGPIVDLFTDGACVVNQGPGGWAFILRHRDSKREKAATGGVARTTNNRMELMAVIQGLSALRRACHVHLFTDSQYVARGISEWSPKWKKFGWRKTANAKQQILNADLWATLDELSANHTVVAQWVRSHAGHPENERCDLMAERAAQAVAESQDTAMVNAIESP